MVDHIGSDGTGTLPLAPARRRSQSPLGGLWPAGRPRILVADSWLANAGDGAISVATDRRIRRLVPEAAVLHAAYQSDLVGDCYPDLAFVPPLAALACVAPVLPEADGWTIDALARLLDGADLVLSQGGGFLIEHYEPWERLLAYERVLDRDIPLGFMAQTIGSFEREDKHELLAGILRRAVIVGVRDRRSLANVTELGVPADRTRLTADEALSLFRRPPRWRRRRGVAMVLSCSTLIGEEGYVADEPDLLASVAEILRLVVEASAPEPVTVLSTTQGLGSLDRGLEDDELFADEVIAALPPALRRHVRPVRGYLPPLRCADLISRHRALVSMRMHPVIFALSRGVPAVAVTRAHKALDLLAELGMDDRAPAWLDPPAIAAALRRALAGDERRGIRLWARLGEARRRASLNDDVMGELLAAAPQP